MSAVVVISKAPVPGAVKTRLCPPYTPDQAADLAAAALADVIAAASAVPVPRRVLLLAGYLTAPPGWEVVEQRGQGLADRLAHGYADIGPATLIIAGDAPQVTPDTLTTAVWCLDNDPVDAVLGLTPDGGFWALGLRDPAYGAVLRAVPMSAPTTGADTLAALRQAGLRVALLPQLRDVDTPVDAAAVAAAHPGTRFAAALRAITPSLPLGGPGVASGSSRL